MSSAIVIFPGVTAITPRTSRYEQGDTHHWRKRHHDFKNDQRREACKCCKGTGQMWIYIDEEPKACPRCQRAYTGWDDMNESAF